MSARSFRLLALTVLAMALLALGGVTIGLALVLAARGEAVARGPAWATVPTAAPGTQDDTTGTPPTPSATRQRSSPTVEPRGTPLRVTATPVPPSAGPTRIPAVDWPTLADPGEREPEAETASFRVFARDPADPLLAEAVRRWAPELEEILAQVSKRLGGRPLPEAPLNLVFTRSYPGRCPARGLASVVEEPPLIMIFLDEATGERQIRAVLAHEMAHHLSLSEDFVGDGVLTEGIANWAADRMMLAWQGIPSWDAAVRAQLAEGSYVSLTDDAALNPGPGEDCIARRDRIYNARTAFVDWLIRREGLDTVLAMPYVEVETPDPEGGEPFVDAVPDYRAATGLDLPELEALWLRSLLAPPQPEAAFLAGRGPRVG